MRACASGSSAARFMSTPMRRIRSGCCARAASGHAAAAPPSSVMNSRRSHSITSSARASSARRHVEAERLGDREIDDQLEFGRLLDRQVARLRAAQNLVDIVGCAAKQVRNMRAVRHQPCRIDVFAQAEHRRQSCAQRQDVDAMAVGVGQRVAAHVERLAPALELLERGHNILGAQDFEPVDFEAERVRRGLNLAHLLHRPGIAGIAEHRQPAEPGDDLAQDFEPLASRIGSIEWTCR